MKELIRKAKSRKKASDIQAAIRAIDKASKTHLLHKNKAARLKSTLAKLITHAPAKKTAKKPGTKKKKAATS